MMNKTTEIVKMQTEKITITHKIYKQCKKH